MTEETNTTRRPYRPPQLEQVQLAVEEAVLQACKVPNKGGPDDLSSCFSGTPVIKCVDPGT